MAKGKSGAQGGTSDTHSQQAGAAFLQTPDIFLPNEEEKLYQIFIKRPGNSKKTRSQFKEMRYAALNKRDAKPHACSTYGAVTVVGSFSNTDITDLFENLKEDDDNKLKR